MGGGGLSFQAGSMISVGGQSVAGKDERELTTIVVIVNSAVPLAFRKGM